MKAFAGALVAVALACLVLVACGCGGGNDRLSEEDYFARVEDLFNTADAEVLEAGQSLGEPGLSEEELHSRIVANSRLAVTRYQQLADDLERLSPPMALTALHDDLVESIRDYLDKESLFLDFDEAQGFDSGLDPSDPAAVAWQDAFEASSTASTHIGDICGALEDEADRKGHAIELDCAGSASVESPDYENIAVAPGIRGRLADTPPLPAGLVALTQYIEFEVEGENSAVTIGLPLLEPVEDAGGLGWYSYEGGAWVRLDANLDVVSGGDVGTKVAQGDFDSVPASLVVLREE